VLEFADALEAALVEGGALARPAAPVPLPLAPPEGQEASQEPSKRGSDRSRPRRRRAHVGIRRGVHMLLASVVVAGALWGGLARGRVGARWRHWQEGFFGERAATNSNEGGSR
jgi:hypothetical protein